MINPKAVAMLAPVIVAGLVGLIVYTYKKPAVEQEDKPVPKVEEGLAVGEELGNKPVAVPELPPQGVTEPEAKNEVEGKESTLPEPMPSPAELSDNPLWQRFALGDFATRLVRALDEVNMGEVPRISLGEFFSQEKYTAVRRGQYWYISPATGERYQGFVDCICGIDVGKAAKLYGAIKPAMQAAINVLGYQDKTPDDFVNCVFTMFRDIPEYPEDAPMLRLTENLYQWQNLELEQLSPVQKCLLRLGAANFNSLRAYVEKLQQQLQAE